MPSPVVRFGFIRLRAIRKSPFITLSPTAVGGVRLPEAVAAILAMRDQWKKNGSIDVATGVIPSVFSSTRFAKSANRW